MHTLRPSISALDTTVLICGGGPTGLTLAIVLRRHGISCRIIDRDPQYHGHSRGKGIQPRTLEVFDDLGIVDEIRAHGTSSGGVRFYTNKHPVATVVLPELAPRPGIPYPSLLIIPQFETERIMRKRLADVDVVIEHGRELVAFHDDGHQVIARVKNTATGQVEHIRSSYLIGCDGGRSFVRRQLELNFQGENHDQFWVLGDMEIEGLDRDVTAHAWFADDHSYLNATKLPGVNSWQVQASIRPDGAGQVEEASLEVFQRFFTERTGLPNVRVSNPTWLSNYNVKRRMVDRYRKGRVFVAGDAAHIHSPAGGQGLNTGVQDAYNLGWKLALVLQGKADSRLLDTYEEERLPIAQSVLRSSETGNSLFFSNNPFIAFFRRWVFLPILRLPPVTAALLLTTAELDLNYRGASLAQANAEQSSGGRRWFTKRRIPRAGDRAPDARVRDARNNAPTRLFDAFRGPHWTLLLFSGTKQNTLEDDKLTMIARRFTATFGDDVQTCLVRSSAHRPVVQHDENVTVLVDDRGEAYALYGSHGATLVLVRPDGYIGVRSQLATAEVLFTDLNNVLGVARGQPVDSEPVLV